MRHIDHSRDTGAQLDLQGWDVERVTHDHLQGQRAVEAAALAMGKIVSPIPPVGGNWPPPRVVKRGTEEPARADPPSPLAAGGAAGSNLRSARRAGGALS